MTKTNAMRALDRRGIAYTPITFSPAIHSGDGVATVIGEPAARVFKTLVVLRERGGPLLVITRSDRELDLKRCAATVGEKRVRMASQMEAEALTGLLVGGISALALLGKGFTVYLDSSAMHWDELYVSAGQRGINLRLRPTDLIHVTGAQVIDLEDHHA